MHMRGFDLTCTRCYNQRCINKSENAANTATKSSEPDSGPAEKGLAEVCLKRKSFHLADRRRGERSDVAEVQAVMFHSGETGETDDENS